jgi:sigma54-dependent transcription regulator
MMATQTSVLVSWVAVNNDPYERNPKSGDFVIQDGQPIPGPTLTLLFDSESIYKDRIQDVVLLHRKDEGRGDSREQRALQDTVTELERIAPKIRIHLEPWGGDDPTDHRAIFEFLQERVPEIRKRFPGRELVIHISPGTPSMQTIWVLLGETGFIEAPFQMVKSYRRSDRHGKPPVVNVEVGLDTFFKAYRLSHPSQVASEEDTVLLDPSKFRTDKMRTLFMEARRFAQVNIPVLILGERGTGKSTLAGWMRLHSPYRQAKLDSNWPAVACGQYTTETMRAELFGYKKGAFTGANSDKLGILSAADGDTLFLDEIADVSRDLQRLLIKAIEEKRFFPLGDLEAHKSDFRLISATNLDSDALDERLDPDFRDRINTLTLRMPPLREIRNELGWLWNDVFHKACTRSGVDRRQVRLTEPYHHRVVQTLEKHQLTGNMRDLFKVAYRIIAARADSCAPLSPTDAVDYGLAVLDEVTHCSEYVTSRAVAKCFATATFLDDVVSESTPLSTRDLEHELRFYVATEIRRLSRVRVCPIEKLCDVSDRSLRTWVGLPTSGNKLPKTGTDVPKTEHHPSRKSKA